MREPTTEQAFGDDDRRPMRVEGAFTAHICKLTSRAWPNGNEVFNLTSRLSEENKKTKVPLYVYDEDSPHKRKAVLDDDGTQKFISAEFMVDAEIQDDGSWFYEEAGHDWQTNEKYADRMDAIGVEFPEKEVGTGKNKKMKSLLQKIDADDILGMPVVVEIGWSKYKVREKDADDNWTDAKDSAGKQLYGEALKVIGYSPWVGGKRIELAEGDEPAPF